MQKIHAEMLQLGLIQIRTWRVKLDGVPIDEKKESSHFHDNENVVEAFLFTD